MPPLMLGVGSLGLDDGRHGLDRPPHRPANSARRAAGRPHRRRAISGSSTPAASGTRSQDLARSINRMCAQLREMQQTIRQSERTRLLAQLAAGLAHQLRNSLTGARMSVQLHAKRCPAAESDQSLNVALEADSR